MNYFLSVFFVTCNHSKDRMTLEVLDAVIRGTSPNFGCDGLLMHHLEHFGLLSQQPDPIQRQIALVSD